MTSTPKLDQLTFTRFLAALSVLFFHGGRQWGILAYFPMLTSGTTAVSYFYVLSGFVMTIAYHHRPKDWVHLGRYMLARFSRIYPVYLLSFVLTCIYYIDLIAKTKPREILVNVLLIQAWFPEYVQSFNIAAWSLSVEVFFYLIFPFLLIGISKLSHRTVLFSILAFWGMSQLAYSTFMIVKPDDLYWLAYFPLFHLNAFLVGVAGGVWFLLDDAHREEKTSVSVSLVFLSLAVVLLLLSLREYVPAYFRNMPLDVGLLAPFFLILILALAADRSHLSKILGHPRLVLLGDASYALYILHIPCRWILEKILSNTGMPVSSNFLFGIYAVAAIFLSLGVFKYFEHPVRDWFRRNPYMVLLMVFDGLMIAGMIALAYQLRLGDGVAGVFLSRNFSVRAGVVLLFSSLVIFRYYVAPSWRVLVPAMLLGTTALTILLYMGWGYGWVEGFPRPIILLLAFLVFIYFFFSRYVFCRFVPVRLTPPS